MVHFSTYELDSNNMNEKTIQITTKLCVKNSIILFCFIMYPQQYKLFDIHNWVLGLIAFGIDVCWITLCWIGKTRK